MSDQFSSTVPSLMYGVPTYQWQGCGQHPSHITFAFLLRKLLRQKTWDFGEMWIKRPPITKETNRLVGGGPGAWGIRTFEAWDVVIMFSRWAGEHFRSLSQPLIISHACLYRFLQRHPLLNQNLTPPGTNATVGESSRGGSIPTAKRVLGYWIDRYDKP